MAFRVERAQAGDVAEVAAMLGELLEEIMTAVGVRAFDFSLEETTERLAGFLERQTYVVFVARDERGAPLGFIALCESYALYAGGAFGTIPELYVRPGARSQSIGRRLLEQAKALARARGWTRLEVTTPPLPEFERALAFYRREAFEITGGRKLQVPL